MTLPKDIPTTLGLAAASLAALAACALAARRLLRPAMQSLRAERLICIVIMAILLFLLTYRIVRFTDAKGLVHSHVDGILLLATLLTGLLVYFHAPTRMPAVSLFFLPVLAFWLLWGFCASWWSYEPFNIVGIWEKVHLVTVYLGSMAVAAAAIFGIMYLFLAARLRKKRNFATLDRFPSLEAVERRILRSAIIGFPILTIGIITGLLIQNAQRPNAADWLSPKILLAAAIWLVYGLMIHLPFLPIFRGRRAAFLSILGLVILLVLHRVSLPAAIQGVPPAQPPVSRGGA